MNGHASIQDSIQEITLRIGQMGVQRALDETWLFAERPEIRTRFVIEEMKTMLAALVRFAEQPCKPITYPADWWQAVKERFAPAWALRRWPVVHTVWEPSVIYPDIALPERQYRITMRRLDYLPSWPLS